MHLLTAQELRAFRSSELKVYRLSNGEVIASECARGAVDLAEDRLGLTDLESDDMTELSQKEIANSKVKVLCVDGSEHYVTYRVYLDALVEKYGADGFPLILC